MFLRRDPVNRQYVTVPELRLSQVKICVEFVEIKASQIGLQ